MKKKCQKCGKEYKVSSFKLDSDYCAECTTAFLSFSRDNTNTPEQTRSVFYKVIISYAIMILLALLFSPLAYCWKVIFFLFCMMIYLIAKAIIFRIFNIKYPTLTAFKYYCLVLSPLYGLILFISIWSFIRAYFFNDLHRL